VPLSSFYCIISLMFGFEIKKEYGKARRGVLSTPHGKINTPAFVPVATKGALKGMGFDEASALGAEIFMVNTFHFYCSKEYETVERFGGLHRFLGTDHPLMTDSGGFQVFSLGAGWGRSTGKLPHKGASSSTERKEGMVRIKEKGVVFKSPFNGDIISITPEDSIRAQEALGADIIFAFDECTSPADSYDYQKDSLERTHRWAERSLNTLKNDHQAMMGIVQGGRFEDLRKNSARYISSLPFFGFGIGGSFGESFGDSKENMYSILDLLSEELPPEKPKHLLGIGEPEDLVEAVKRGVDLFDCVIPTRFARHGTILSSHGRVNIRSSRFKDAKGPLDENCSCRVCLNYHKGYLHHLSRRREIYGIMLLMVHNLHFILHLMADVREGIEKGDLSEVERKKERFSS